MSFFQLTSVGGFYEDPFKSRKKAVSVFGRVGMNIKYREADIYSQLDWGYDSKSTGVLGDGIAQQNRKKIRK